MSFAITFILLLVFWIFMSGLFDLWHFGLGIISCALVAYMSNDLLFTDKQVSGKGREVIRLIKYLPWLLYQIYLANIYVVKLALSPRMSDRIYPHIVKFRTTLKKDLSVFTFANSITLTPGTITVLVENDCFYVHAIDKPWQNPCREKWKHGAGIFSERTECIISSSRFHWYCAFLFCCACTAQYGAPRCLTVSSALVLWGPRQPFCCC